VPLYLEPIDEAGLPKDTLFREAVRSHVEFGARVAQLAAGERRRARPDVTGPGAKGRRFKGPRDSVATS
jgi:hypothetical protein